MALKVKRLLKTAYLFFCVLAIPRYNPKPLWAFFKTAISIFFICNMARMAALAFLGSSSPKSSLKIVGTICQETPNRSCQPHCSASGTLERFQNRSISLRLAVDHKGDCFRKRKGMLMAAIHSCKFLSFQGKCCVLDASSLSGPSFCRSASCSNFGLAI